MRILAFYVAFERKNNPTDAKKALAKVEQHSKELQGLLCDKMKFSAGSFDAIKDLFTYCGWYAANERANYKTDAMGDQDKVSARWLWCRCEAILQQL
jgi:hypothetical protein